MKKHSVKIAFFAALLAVSTVYLNSCTKLADLVQYDLNMQTADLDFVIPPFPDTTMTLTGTQTINYNVDSFIKANTKNLLSFNNITSAKVTSCNIVLENASATNNFANFRSCSASFTSNANSTAYNIGAANPADAFSSSLNLSVDTTQDLKAYFINANSFNYSLSGSLRRPLTDSLHAHVTMTYRLHVKG